MVSSLLLAKACIAPRGINSESPGLSSIVFPLNSISHRSFKAVNRFIKFFVVNALQQFCACADDAFKQRVGIFSVFALQAHEFPCPRI